MREVRKVGSTYVAIPPHMPRIWRRPYALLVALSLKIDGLIQCMEAIGQKKPPE